jgi:hypothetical protein
MRIGVTGASGFVGRRLVELAAERGHAVVRFGRSEADRVWDPAAAPPDLKDLDAVVHLAGDPVAEGRWTRAKMARIRDSRVAGTRALAAAFGPGGPKTLVSASAIGYYGDRADEELTEDSAPGTDFLAGVCREWEEEARKAPARVALVRIGIVLGPGGGALAKMLTPFKLGLGGRLGSGRQWMSWVHRDDLAALLLHAAENDAVTGPLLGTAPNPVANHDFTKTLGRVLGRPTILPMPRWQVRLLFGRIAEVLCGSQRCRALRPAASGFAFRHPDLEAALREILGS